MPFKIVRILVFILLVFYLNEQQQITNSNVSFKCLDTNNPLLHLFILSEFDTNDQTHSPP